MTALRQLVEDRLGVPLDRFLANSVKMGWSVRKIAAVLSDETSVNVSKSAVHNWLRDVRAVK